MQWIARVAAGFVLTCALACIFAGVSAAASDTGSDAALQGFGLFNAGRYEAAAEAFGRAGQEAQLPIERSRMAYFRGCALARLGRWSDAASEYQLAIDAAPDGKYGSLARMALTEAAAVENPLGDFPTSLYLYVQARWGGSGLKRLDAALDAWERVKWVVIVLPLVFFGWWAARRLRRRLLT